MLPRPPAVMVAVGHTALVDAALLRGTLTGRCGQRNVVLGPRGDRAVELARLSGGELVAVAVEAHLPHCGATVGEVADEHQVEERACHRWLTAAEVCHRARARWSAFRPCWGLRGSRHRGQRQSGVLACRAQLVTALRRHDGAPFMACLAVAGQGHVRAGREGTRGAAGFMGHAGENFFRGRQALSKCTIFSSIAVTPVMLTLFSSARIVPPAGLARSGCSWGRNAGHSCIGVGVFCAGHGEGVRRA